MQPITITHIDNSTGLISYARENLNKGLTSHIISVQLIRTKNAKTVRSTEEHKHYRDLMLTFSRCRSSVYDWIPRDFI